MMRRFMLAAVAASSLWTSASAAGEPKTLEEVFAPLSEGLCVTIDAVRAVGATVQLTPEQFQFVRGFWMAIPPATRGLPPGDKAFLAKDSNGVGAFGLFDDGGEVCAVFQATDWIERVVDDVGRCETGKLGQAM
jgi:hypothetical protein